MASFGGCTGLAWPEGPSKDPSSSDTAYVFNIACDQLKQTNKQIHHSPGQHHDTMPVLLWLQYVDDRAHMHQQNSSFAVDRAICHLVLFAQ